MLRLFLALRPPLPIREMLFDLMDGIGGARWQDDEQLHVTTRFLGEVDPRLADDIVTEIDRLRLSLTPAAPTVALHAVGQFASRGRTDTLWAGVTPHTALTALHRKVDQAVVRAGLPPDRRAYLPHVTLARLPRSLGTSPEIDGWIARHAGLASAPFAMTHLTLYQSHLGRDGAWYEPLLRWPLEPDTGTAGDFGGFASDQ